MRLYHQPPFPHSLTLGRLGGLPKKTQTFFFFQIDKNRVSEFRKQLAKFVPEITTTTNVVKNREDIDRNKAEAQKSNTKPSLLEISGINISFTKKGLTQVRKIL